MYTEYRVVIFDGNGKLIKTLCVTTDTKWAKDAANEWCKRVESTHTVGMESRQVGPWEKVGAER